MPDSLEFLITLVLGGLGFILFVGMVIGTLLGISHIFKVLSGRQTKNNHVKTRPVKKPSEKEEIENRVKVGLDNNFQNYSPYEFEKFIAKLFEKMGYQAWVTSKSGDYGLDIIAEKGNKKVGIQVKRYKETNPVGVKTVRNTLGSKFKIDANHTVLITTSYFTVRAEEQAKDAPIELWDREKLHEMVEKYFIKTEVHNTNKRHFTIEQTKTDKT